MECVYVFMAILIYVFVIYSSQKLPPFSLHAEKGRMHTWHYISDNWYYPEELGLNRRC